MKIMHRKMKEFPLYNITKQYKWDFLKTDLRYKDQKIFIITLF